MPCRIYKLYFQDKNLKLDRNSNLGSPDHQPGALNLLLVLVLEPYSGGGRA